MVKHFFYCQSFVRIEVEHFKHQILKERRNFFHTLLAVLMLWNASIFHFFQEGCWERAIEAQNIVFSDILGKGKNFLNLLRRRSSRKQGPLGHNLINNAAETPNISRSGIFFRAKENLWGPVPAGRHSLCQNRGIIVLGFQRPCKTEIAYFY